jgi:hypothetical protein
VETEAASAAEEVSEEETEVASEEASEVVSVEETEVASEEAEAEEAESLTKSKLLIKDSSYHLTTKV